MYRITTDSVVDLTPERMKELDVAFASLRVHIGETELLDDMRPETIETLMKAMREGKAATTSQVTEADFVKLWTPILEAQEDILYIGMSSGLSGTVNSAHIARLELLSRYPERKILVFDSLALSSGEGILLEEAVQMKNSGITLEACYKKLEQLKDSLQQWFTLADLTYARRGGRVSGAAAAVASLLHIKPVLSIDREGKVITPEKIKGRRGAIRRLYEILCEKIDSAYKYVHITQVECMEEAKALAKSIQERFPELFVRIYTVGAVIGTHGGPGTISLSFVGKGVR
ncbi:MAG TPA: DegV family protein [Feifaniaceae bacterium]|nr:DegV family protein [Feifaniaceae bacterium]